MATSKAVELAKEILTKLDNWDNDRREAIAAYGDSRSVYYDGILEFDLRDLAELVVEEGPND